MRTSLFITRSGAAAMLLGAWILPASVSAQQRDDSRPSPPQPVYNPYPPGLLPPDLESEIARVVRSTRIWPVAPAICHTRASADRSRQ